MSLAKIRSRRAISRPRLRASPAWLVQKEGAHGGTWVPPCCTAGRINAPRPALVEASPVGVPVRVNREGVALVREEWRVVDRWWTEDPLDRRYFDVVLESGQNACVFRDEEAGCWFSQRA